MSWLKGAFADVNKCLPPSMKTRSAFNYSYYCPIEACEHALIVRAKKDDAVDKGKPFASRKMLKQHFDRAHQGWESARALVGSCAACPLSAVRPRVPTTTSRTTCPVRTVVIQWQSDDFPHSPLRYDYSYITLYCR